MGKKIVPTSMSLFLFFTFFKVALFVIGGGLVMVPMIEDIFVRRKRLLCGKDILNMVAIMQTMPGMMAVNAAIFVGHKLAGIKGAITAAIGVILPSIIIMTIIAASVENLDIQNPHILRSFSCVRACAMALFAGTAYRLSQNLFHNRFDFIFASGLLIALMVGVSQSMLILCSIPIGCGIVFWQEKSK